MLLRLLRLFVFAAACNPRGLASARRRQKVPYAGDAKPGTIVIQSEERRLIITGKDQARKYPVGSSPFRQAMVRHHADRQQTRQAGVEAACVAAR